MSEKSAATAGMLDTGYAVGDQVWLNKPGTSPRGTVVAVKRRRRGGWLVHIRWDDMPNLYRYDPEIVRLCYRRVEVPR